MKTSQQDNVSNDEWLLQLLHKANNHLAVIWGYAQLLERDKSLSNTKKEWIKRIADECVKLKEELESVQQN